MRFYARIGTGLGLLCFFGPRMVPGLEIPLTGGAESHGATIGYVDMERIFQIYPQTLNAKEDYLKQLKKKKDQLAYKEQELSDLQNRISVLENTVKDMGAPASVSTSTVNASSGTVTAPPKEVPQNLNSMKASLEEKRSDLEEIRKQAATDLATFQSQQSQMILGKIYQALRDLALEEQVSVVVDKSSILYGDATIDLTEKLQQRVRGF